MKQITVNGYNVWVDEQAEIEKNDCCYNYLNKEVIYSVYNKIPIEFGKTHKIICADKEANLEGVPTRDEWLADEYSQKEFPPREYPEIEFNNQRHNCKIDFLEGYQSAKQDLPTWQYVEKAIFEAIRRTGEGYNGEYCGGNYPNIEIEFFDVKEEIINQLKNDKL